MTAKTMDGARRPTKGVLGAVLVLLSLPAVWAAVGAVSFHVGNRTNGAIVSSGLAREYLLYVPRTYDRTERTPLVISMHGGASWPAAQRRVSGWNTVADEHGFIVVYPSGLSGRGPRAWRADGGPGQEQDVQFIAELIDTLLTSYNIDPSRIYVNGLSNGGGMAFVLSCTLSERIAAVGVVATAIFLPWRACTDQRAVPMVAFHGTADSLTRYHGGKSWVAPNLFPDIPRWTEGWARRNRCGPNPVDAVVATDVTRRSYTKCADGADVLLYTVHGGGHTWPGGEPLPEWLVGPTSNSISATRHMWSFFREHSLGRS